MTIKEYIDDAIINGKTITIRYEKYDGTISQRTISDIQYSDEYGYGEDYICAYCHLRNEKRTFKISRIKSVDGISSISSTNVSQSSPKKAFSPILTSTKTPPTPTRSHKLTQSNKNTLSTSPYNNSAGNYNYTTKPTSYSSKNHSEGCYIATMAYGDYEHPQVLTLRAYRDTVLKATIIGKVFIKVYYAISPLLVKLLKNNKFINKLIRNKLDIFASHIRAKYINIE